MTEQQATQAEQMPSLVESNNKDWRRQEIRHVLTSQALTQFRNQRPAQFSKSIQAPQDDKLQKTSSRYPVGAPSGTRLGAATDGAQAQHALESSSTKQINFLKI